MGAAIWQKEMCDHSGFNGWTKPSCSLAARVIFSPTATRSAASSGAMAKPRPLASAITKLSPPYAVSTCNEPRPSTSIHALRRSAKEGTFLTSTRWTLPSRQSATTSIRPPGASSTSRVCGSVIGRMPLSSSTVATHSELEPDMGGVSAGSMMIQAICALGSLAGTSRLTWRNTPPRGSLSTKLRRVWSWAIQRDCSHTVAPGGGATPPTITSPTSPSAWQLTT
ncbi:hypothetical protein D3C78_1221010 [compost metagenome]